MIMNPGDIQTDGRRKMKWFSFAEVELIILPELPHISVYSLQSVQRELYNLQRPRTTFIWEHQPSTQNYSVTQFLNESLLHDLQICANIHTINIVNRWNYSELLLSDYSPKDVSVFPLEALCCCSAAVLHAGRYLHQRMEHQCALL